MIKVCHMTSAHNTNDVRIFIRECSSLAKHGFDVYLVGKGESREENGVHVIGFGTPSASRLKRMMSDTKIVYNLAVRIDADIYHFHDPELLTIALRLKKTGKKVIFDSHEIYTEQIRTKKYIPKVFRSLIAEIYFKYETYILKRIDAVICPCKVEGRGIDKKLSFENRSKLVGYVNNYPRIEELSYKEKKYPAREKIICYSGSLTYERGIQYLVKAANIAEVKLLLAGRFSPKKFKETIMSKDSSVVYRGFLSRDELSKFYHESWIGMCTLLPIGQYHQCNNLPTKAYEYMGMGLPIIISDFPYNREFIKTYPVGLLVDPENENDIAEKIGYLFSHQNEAEEMGKLGRELFLEKYNWTAAEKELLKVYEKLESLRC